MPRWTPETIWDRQDALIIGGGPSIKNLDWSLFEKENTIGCNTAFIHGPNVCKICIFGDYVWWTKFQTRLQEYADAGGVVFTNNHKITASNYKFKWVWTIGRETKGLHRRSLGWNGNIGASAINLAILLGAKRVFLLGYDMKIIDGRSNWHDYILNRKLVRPSVYVKFSTQYIPVIKDWKSKFPDVEIWNVTSDSGLSKDLIPWLSPTEFWAGRA